MTEHKHAELLRAIADEGIEATKEFECMRFGWERPNWALTSLYLNPIIHEPELWLVRRRAKMLRIRAVEFPEPVREKPDHGEEYWVVYLTGKSIISVFFWDDTPYETMWLQRGLLHTSKEAARQHAEALIKLSGGTV